MAVPVVVPVAVPVVVPVVVPVAVPVAVSVAAGFVVRVATVVVVLVVVAVVVVVTRRVWVAVADEVAAIAGVQVFLALPFSLVRVAAVVVVLVVVAVVVVVAGRVRVTEADEVAAISGVQVFLAPPFSFCCFLFHPATVWRVFWSPTWSDFPSIRPADFLSFFYHCHSDHSDHSDHFDHCCCGYCCGYCDECCCGCCCGCCCCFFDDLLCPILFLRVWLFEFCPNTTSHSPRLGPTAMLFQNQQWHGRIPFDSRRPPLWPHTRRRTGDRS